MGRPGVTRVEFVAPLPRPDVWVWLGTTTDAERDRLQARVAHDDGVRVRLPALLGDALTVAGVTVQSEETVARDHEGSWFYALR